MKDNFSTKSDKYAIYRPSYSDSLVDYITGFVADRKNAWDCGTGNGQFAAKLANYFEHVYATDISQQQIEHAVQFSNVSYTVQPAEHTTFPDNFFDLIVVAQAVHWFNFDSFYQEVNRAMKASGLIAIVGYNLIRITPEVDDIVDHFYHNIVGSYWDKERKYVEEGYQTIPFPFNEFSCKEFSQTIKWTFNHLIGYFGTWSAVKHFQKDQGFDPVEQVKDRLKEAWGNDTEKDVTFPILLRIGSNQ